MAIPLYLQQFKAAGIYRIVWDKSVIMNQDTQMIRLVVGYSEKGPFNIPVYVKDTATFKTLFGDISKKLEKRGVYFHRLALQMLKSSPILCLNLKKFSGETVDGVTINATFNPKYNPLENHKLRIEDVYTTTRFWELDAEKLNNLGTVSGHKLDQYINIAATGVKSQSVTYFIRKACGSKVSQYNITVNDWYSDQIDAKPEYLEGKEGDLMSDYFAEIYVFGGQFSPKQVLGSATLRNYFDAIEDSEGNLQLQLKKYYLDGFGDPIDTLDALYQDATSNALGHYVGSLIPRLKDKQNTYVSLDTVFNSDIDTHHVMMSFNEDLLEEGLVDINLSGRNKIYRLDSEKVNSNDLVISNIYAGTAKSQVLGNVDSPVISDTITFTNNIFNDDNEVIFPLNINSKNPGNVSITGAMYITKDSFKVYKKYPLFELYYVLDEVRELQNTHYAESLDAYLQYLYDLDTATIAEGDLTEDQRLVIRLTTRDIEGKVVYKYQLKSNYEVNVKANNRILQLDSELHQIPCEDVDDPKKLAGYISSIRLNQIDPSLGLGVDTDENDPGFYIGRSYGDTWVSRNDISPNAPLIDAGESKKELKIFFSLMTDSQGYVIFLKKLGIYAKLNITGKADGNYTLDENNALKIDEVKSDMGLCNVSTVPEFESANTDSLGNDQPYYIFNDMIMFDRSYINKFVNSIRRLESYYQIGYITQEQSESVENGGQVTVWHNFTNEDFIEESDTQSTIQQYVKTGNDIVSEECAQYWHPTCSARITMKNPVALKDGKWVYAINVSEPLKGDNLTTNVEDLDLTLTEGDTAIQHIVYVDGYLKYKDWTKKDMLEQTDLSEAGYTLEPTLSYTGSLEQATNATLIQKFIDVLSNNDTANDISDDLVRFNTEKVGKVLGAIEVYGDFDNNSVFNIQEIEYLTKVKLNGGEDSADINEHNVYGSSMSFILLDQISWEWSQVYINGILTNVLATTNTADTSLMGILHKGDYLLAKDDTLKYNEDGSALTDEDIAEGKEGVGDADKYMDVVMVQDFGTGTDLSGNKVIYIQMTGQPFVANLPLGEDKEGNPFYTVNGAMIKVDAFLNQEIGIMKPQYLKGYTYINDKPEGTGMYAKVKWQEDILSALTDYKGLRTGLLNKSEIDYRYVIDTFESFPTESLKVVFATLCKEKQSAFCISNFPSVKSFVKCPYTSFVDNDGIFNVQYVAEGMNKKKTASVKFSLPSDFDGASFIAFYSPLKYSDGYIDNIVPSAGLVSNLFVEKYMSRQPYYIVAGPNYGHISDSGLVGPDYRYSTEELQIIEPFGVNVMVYRPNFGTFINANQTAKQTPVSALSKVHVRELVIYMQDEIEKVLQSYQWEFNNARTRNAILDKANSICENVMANGGLQAYQNIMDETNNGPEIIDNEMAVLSTHIEPGMGCGKMVQELTLYRTGKMKSALAEMK